jgi:muramoyltetrapeptide carboxypeptidase
MSHPVLKPLALPAHPVVAVIAPASSAQQIRIDAGAAALKARGWQLRFGAHAQGREAPYFSGSTANRLADLHAAFSDPEVDVILCTRGGYGSNYLLPGLDLDLIRAHPKPLLGYSDLTAVQTWLLDQTGLVAFHAPLLAGDFYLPDGVDDASLEAVLSGQPHHYGAAEGLRTLRPGAAEGVLYGGCLTLLTASLGTPYAPLQGPADSTEGKLLFLEDIGTRPYQVDRMLRQLVLAGKLQGVSGILFGEMVDCVSPGAPAGLLEQAILNALAGFPGPIAMGLRSGHVSRSNVTLPLGIRARITAATDACELKLLEPAVRARAEDRSANVRS